MQGTYLGGYPWKDFSILTASDLNAAIGMAETLSFNAVQRAGDTMTGPLVINLNPAPATPPAGGTILHLKGVDGATEHVYINAYSNGVFGAAPSIQCAAAAGTGVTPAPLHSGDFLGSLSYAGYWRSAAGASGWSTNRAAFQAFALDNFSDIAQGTQVQIKATPPGTTSLTTVLTISPGLQVGAPTGGDRGAGSINAQAIYINNQAVGAATGAVPITGGTMTGPLVVNLNAAPATPPAGGTVLHLKGVDGATEHIYINAYSTGILGAAPNITLAAARGTGAAPAALQSGDFLGALSFQGYGATGWSGNRVGINAFALENWDHSGVNNTAQGTQLQIRTTPVGSTTLATRLTIGPGLQVGSPTSGDMGAGTLNAQAVYVQGVAVTAGGLSGAVPLTGGTMTGMLGVNFNAAALAVTGLGAPLIHTAGADNTPAVIVLDAYTTAGNTATINFRTAAGTAASPATVNPTNAMNLGAFRFYGYDATVGSFESLGPAARIGAIVNGPWTNTSHPTRFDFSVAQPGSTGVATSPGMTLAQGLVVGGPAGGTAGDMGFGTVNAQQVYVQGVPVMIGMMTAPMTINLNAAAAQAALAGTALQISGADGVVARLEIDAYNGGVAGNSSNILLRTARGTNSPTPAFSPMLQGDLLGGIVVRAYGAAGYSAANRATLIWSASENWGTGSTGVSGTGEGVQMSLSTTALGTTTLTARLQIGPLGGIVIGNPAGGTNGDMGAGTINISTGGLYVNGVAVTVP